ncbi:MAG: PAS domain-containing methyl-accepting chemotaxis protein, partial [Oleibacter sp.]|nr:PAS domain-containing methyl-accepting chemotaxis protein [Thalassolituus sp.]
MKNTGPVTNQEYLFDADQELISSTDLTGKINFCNEAFVTVSGYSRDELIGKPHNLVRHPDMPKEAFESMWTYLKNGKAWMGMVKNRRKNGDYYWVNAYVTPVFIEGKLTGYESVRRFPDRKTVERAEAVYGRMRAGTQNRYLFLQKFKNYALRLLPLVIFAAVGFMISDTYGFIEGITLGLLAGALATTYLYKKRMVDIRHAFSDCFHDPLAALIYHQSDDVGGQVAMAMTSQDARIKTVLARMVEASKSVADETQVGLSRSQEAHEKIEKQQQETHRISTSMARINEAIQNIVTNVKETSNSSFEVKELVESGNQVAMKTQAAIEYLSDTSQQVASTISIISEETSRITAA